MSHYLDPATRDRIRDGVVSSSEVLADRFIEWFHPRHVVDVGCGEGHLVKAFRDRGVKALGFDGDPSPGVDMVFNLADPAAYQPSIGDEKADLAVSLEVGEHLPDEASRVLVSWLCEHARTVAFSAALPKQGGPNHINERPPAYWVERFAEHGYVGSGGYRWLIWDDDRIEGWYRNNLLVFKPEDAWMRVDQDDPMPDGCPYVIHPYLWELYRK